MGVVPVAGRVPSHSEGQADPASPLASLTEREAEVLRLLGRGLTDAEIAGALYVSPRTVHAHVRSIYKKLNVSHRSAATRIAVQNGLT